MVFSYLRTYRRWMILLLCLLALGLVNEGHAWKQSDLSFVLLVEYPQDDLDHSAGKGGYNEEKVRAFFEALRDWLVDREFRIGDYPIEEILIPMMDPQQCEFFSCDSWTEYLGTFREACSQAWPAISKKHCPKITPLFSGKPFLCRKCVPSGVVDDIRAFLPNCLYQLVRTDLNRCRNQVKWIQNVLKKGDQHGMMKGVAIDIRSQKDPAKQQEILNFWDIALSNGSRLFSSFEGQYLDLEVTVVGEPSQALTMLRNASPFASDQGKVSSRPPLRLIPLKRPESHLDHDVGAEARAAEVTTPGQRSEREKPVVNDCPPPYRKRGLPASKQSGEEKELQLCHATVDVVCLDLGSLQPTLDLRVANRSPSTFSEEDAYIKGLIHCLNCGMSFQQERLCVEKAPHHPTHFYIKRVNGKPFDPSVQGGECVVSGPSFFVAKVKEVDEGRLVCALPPDLFAGGVMQCEGVICDFPAKGVSMSPSLAQRVRFIVPVDREGNPFGNPALSPALFFERLVLAGSLCDSSGKFQCAAPKVILNLHFHSEELETLPDGKLLLPRFSHF